MAAIHRKMRKYFSILMGVGHGRAHSIEQTDQAFMIFLHKIIMFYLRIDAIQLDFLRCIVNDL